MSHNPSAPMPAPEHRSYAQWLEDFKKLAKDDPTSVTKVFVGAFKGEAGKAIVEEVQRIGQTSVSVEELFLHVGQLTKDVDNKNYQLDGKTVDKFSDRWESYRKDFHSILLRSRDIAAEGKSYAEEYSNVIIPMFQSFARKEVDHDSFLTLMDTFLNQIGETEKGSLEVQEMITKLKDNILNMKHEMDTLLEKLDKDFVTRIAKAQAEIDDIHAKISELEAHLSNSYKALYGSEGGYIGGVLLGCAAGLACTGVLAPVALFTIAALSIGSLIGSSISISIIQSDLAAKQNELKTKEAEKAKLEADRKELGTLRERMKEASKDMDQVIAKMGAIATIWATVRADAIELKKAVNMARAQSNPVVLEHILGDSFAGAIYAVLGEILGVYATTVQSLEFTKK